MKTDFIVAGFAILIFGALAAILIVDVPATNKCREMGWTSSKIDFKLNAYCYRRIDNTDYTISVKELLKEQ